MKTIAIITARGGSKRIPRKNIKNFMGKPMLSYAVSAALEANVFDEVMVSTEDEEIASVARACGAQVPFMRSARTADDFSTTFNVLDEVVEEYKKRGRTFDALCCIYPCVPFLRADILRAAYETFLSQEADAVMPVCAYPAPIEWAMCIEDGFLRPFNHETLKKRSQDLSPKYFDVGMFYLCKTDKMYQYGSLCPDYTVPYIIDEFQCQDIDTEADWKTAEIKYKVLYGEKK